MARSLSSVSTATGARMCGCANDGAVLCSHWQSTFACSAGARGGSIREANPGSETCQCRPGKGGVVLGGARR